MPDPGLLHPEVHREYPAGPMASCHALIVRESPGGPEVLLIRRAAEPRRGMWALPGGSVELGETVEEALVREVREETGLEVLPQRLLGLMDMIERDRAGRVRFHFVVLHYTAKPVGGRLAPASDAAEARWTCLDQLDGLGVTDGTLRSLGLAGLIGAATGGIK